MAAKRKTLEGIWHGDCSTDELKLHVTDELRVVTIVCDANLQPRICYFLRLDLEDGQVTDEARLRVYTAVEESNRGNLEHSTVSYQLGRWPRDWRTQVAIAMDVPFACVNNIGIGGLLPLADLLGIPMTRLLGYYKQAFQT